ncbi:MAG: MMPL family transporter [Gammaproteobacteria bacterium]|nr:MMPL family transporter [Gammaproteobacteria bacterium]
MTILVFNLRFSYDLGIFLPAPRTESQKVLIERLGEGPGSRFLLVGLTGAGSDQTETAQQALEESGAFMRVLSSTSTPELSDIPNILWRYRYLLSDESLDKKSLHESLQQRASDLALFAGEEFNSLLGADPGFTSIEIMEALNPTKPVADSWVTDQGTALLIVETRTPAFDLSGQKTAVEAIQNILVNVQNFDPEKIEITGVGAFGVELQDVIQSEATKRSVLASVGLALVLILAYRRWRPLLLAGIPLLTAMIAGLSAVALIFPQVHGITLAFGFTLLGIAIDYPLHLFSHARHQSSLSAIANIWPTLRLGAASTLIAYVGIALSGAQGLAQLGIFTSVGIVTAALVTRWVLPPMMKHKAAELRFDGSSQLLGEAPSLRWSPVILMVVAGGGLMLVAWQNADNAAIWNNNLASLSPVPEDRLSRDHELRQLAGTPDLRHVIALRNSDLQHALRETEKLDNDLRFASARGLVGHWQTVTRLLPSETSQLRRQRKLPDEEHLLRVLTHALSDTPFVLAAFKSFRNDVTASRTLPLLTKEDFYDSPLQVYIDTHLYKHDSEWVSIISLYGLGDIAAFKDWIGDHGIDAELVDLKSASETLVASYRGYTLKLLAIALLAILALLLWRLPRRRALWSLACVLSVLTATSASVYLLNGSLNLYHMMALLLVAGLGLDYVLFMSRDEKSVDDRLDTRHAVIACAVSTTVAFGLLGLSAIPALQSMGSTVAIGTVLNISLAWFGVNRARESFA